MPKKIPLLLLAALLGTALPAHAQPSCRDVNPPPTDSDGYDSHRLCRYPQTTLNAAYRAWRAEMQGSMRVSREAVDTHWLLPNLPARSRTIPVGAAGLVDISYRIAPNRAEVVMTYEGGVSTYRFRPRRGYVELHQITSPD